MKNKEHPLYYVWIQMRQRCRNPLHHSFKNYGGRGIYVYAEWDDFWTFASDVEERPPGCSMDRIDNDGPYAPWNFRWATSYQQKMNSRRVRFITAGGKTMTLTQWARYIGISPSAISHRLNGPPLSRYSWEPRA